MPGNGRMPLDVLDPRHVLLIGPDHGMFLKSAIEDLDGAIGEAYQERRRRSAVRLDRCDWTVGVRVQVL